MGTKQGFFPVTEYDSCKSATVLPFLLSTQQEPCGEELVSGLGLTTLVSQELQHY